MRGSVRDEAAPACCVVFQRTVLPNWSDAVKRDYAEGTVVRGDRYIRCVNCVAERERRRW